MSADNGYLIRQNPAGNYILQMYFASAEDYPPLPAETVVGVNEFPTLEEAVRQYAEVSKTNEFISEYGLFIEI